MDSTDAVVRGSAVVDRFRDLFDAIDEGYCLCEMLLDDEGRPVDYRFLEVNHLFEEMTGLHDPVGRTALELVPDLEPEWVAAYARAAMDGERIRFEQGSEAMGRWFDVFAMPLGGPRQFGIVFKDDTARRRAELGLRDSEARYRDIADRERRISLRLQQALLPDVLATHPRLDIDAHYAASDEALDVGGDWFDTLAWPTGEVGLVVGDVVGHDLEAAAAMGRLRAGTKALAESGPPDAGAVLDALQQCATGPEGTEFVTACVVIVDREAGTLNYASAGHPPPLLRDPDGTTRWLDDTQGSVIGSGLDTGFAARSTPFAPGASVFLYTDGLVEPRVGSIDDGLQALDDAVRRHGPSVGAAELASLVGGTITPCDDIVVLRATRHPEPT